MTVVFLMMRPCCFAESDVIVLTDNNFDEQTAEGEWVLEFYAPWCGFCKNLVPTYEELATSLKADNIRVAKIDCTIETRLQKRFSIRGFPTIKFLSSSTRRVSEYKGNRGLEDLIKFAKGAWENSDSVTEIPTGSPSHSMAMFDDFFTEFEDQSLAFKIEYGFSVWWLFIGVFFGTLVTVSLFLILCCGHPQKQTKRE